MDIDFETYALYGVLAGVAFALLLRAGAKGFALDEMIFLTIIEGGFLGLGLVAAIDMLYCVFMFPTLPT